MVDSYSSLFDALSKKFVSNYDEISDIFNTDDILHFTLNGSIQDETVKQLAYAISDGRLINFFTQYKDSFDKPNFIKTYFHSLYYQKSKYRNHFVNGHKLAIKGKDAYFNDVLIFYYNVVKKANIDTGNFIILTSQLAFEYVSGYSACILQSEIKKIALDIGIDLPNNFADDHLSINNRIMTPIKHKDDNPKVFITYSWDSSAHKDWVRSLANKLIDNGVEIMLDQYDITPGDSFTQFMEKSVDIADKVLVILTPNYRAKSLERKGGVGYEQQIISGEIMSGIQRNKFIPIIRSGTFEPNNDCAIPPHFSGIATIDFTNSTEYDDKCIELIRVIYQTPKLVKPTLGPKPILSQEIYQKTNSVVEPIEAKVPIPEDLTNVLYDGSRFMSEKYIRGNAGKIYKKVNGKNIPVTDRASGKLNIENGVLSLTRHNIDGKFEMFITAYFYPLGVKPYIIKQGSEPVLFEISFDAMVSTGVHTLAFVFRGCESETWLNKSVKKEIANTDWASFELACWVKLTENCELRMDDHNLKELGTLKIKNLILTQKG